MTMTHASLFSGIGGFDLAAEWAGWTNAFNCEIDPFCRKVLKYHFPDAEQYEDIRTTDFTIWRDRIDVLTGGFPCQPFSLAGKRKGTEDDRYLWPEMLPGLFGLFDPVGSWARTFSELLIGRKEWSSTRCVLTWKRQDTKCSRTLYRLAVSALLTGGTDAGLLPTPAVMEDRRKPNSNSARTRKIMSNLNPYSAMALLPTVQTQGLKQCEKGKTVFMPLELLPTPITGDYRSGMSNRYGTNHTQQLNDTIAFQTGTTSQLNPLFVAEMMGFPVDWTVLPFRSGETNPSKDSGTQ